MYVKVRVTTGAKREAVTAIAPDRFEIAVREPREQNLANARIRELLAKQYHVPYGKVRLISGHRSASKIFDISNS